MNPTQLYLKLTEEPRKRLIVNLEEIAKSVGNEDISKVILYSIAPQRKFYTSMMTRGAYDASGGKNPVAREDITVFTEALNLGASIIDDVIDNHLVRFGKPTAKERFGQALTLISALYLIQAGYSRIGKYQVSSLSTLGRTFAGWVNKDLINGKSSTKCEDALRDLSASFGAFTRIASEVAGAPYGVQKLLEKYGYNLGYAMAIMDEIHDLRGEFERPTAEEFNHGNDILIIKKAVEEVVDIRDGKDLWRALKGTNAHDYVINQIEVHAKQAEKCLDGLERSNPKELLRTLVSVVRESLSSIK